MKRWSWVERECLVPEEMIQQYVGGNSVFRDPKTHASKCLGDFALETETNKYLGR